jgi:hypothetical protein
MQFYGLTRTAIAAGVLFAGIAIIDAYAQSPQPGGTQQQKVWKPGEVHAGNTRIYVHVFKTGMGHEHAVVGMVKEGVIHLGAAQNAGSVVADLTSFVADPESARKYIGLPGATDADTQRKVTSNMLGADVLDVLNFATATGTIDSARLLSERNADGLPQYLLEGELAFHGVKKKMQVVAAADERNGWVRLRGHVTLLQSDFGMKPYTTALGAIGVADKLELYGEAFIVKENDIPPPVAPSKPAGQ